MNFLTREQIVAAQDRKFLELDVPEWGGRVRLASFTADEALRQEALVKKRAAGDDTINPVTEMLSASIVDANDKPLFTAEDMAALGKKSPNVLVRLMKRVKKLNVIKDDDAGNSEASQDDVA
jgi:hypothetical protein